MRKILLAFLLLLPASAHADFAGCFVEVGGNTCATGEISCGANPPDNYETFGPIIGKMCDSCQKVMDAANVCNKGFRAIDGAYNLARNILASRNKLITRLYSACGSKCRNIK